jgi:hypothetical protein
VTAAGSTSEGLSPQTDKTDNARHVGDIRGVEPLFEGGHAALEFVGTGSGGTQMGGARETKSPEDS